MTAAAIRLTQVSKSFWVTHEKPAFVRELLPRLFQSEKSEQFWALRGIDLALARGAALGVIGPNGAGKTTLLSIIAGITQPTEGEVRVEGWVAPLLTLGSGFHPELTGLENIFLNGSLLGMSTRQIRQRLDAIIEFSQLHRFIDAPLQTYSSGMQLRLGFAIAIHADCDILVLDEVMIVGDLAFQARCLERLLALKRAGKTLILAAQSVGALRPFVDRIALLHQGRIIAEGTADHVQERYAALTPWLAPVHEPLAPVSRFIFQEQVERHNPAGVRQGWGRQQGTGEARIEEVRLINHEGRAVGSVASGAAITVAARFTALVPLVDPHIGIAIFRDDGTYCYGPNTRMDGLQFHRLERGTYECRLHIETVNLSAGAYRLSVAVWDSMERSPYAYHIARYPFTVLGHWTEGVVILEHRWGQVKSGDGSVNPSLRVEGSGGAQQWFRMFEPLTCTFTAVWPPPTTSNLPTLRAECRGPHGQLWWTSQCSPQHNGHSPEEPQCHQLLFPRLSLLTGSYQWVIGWASEDGAFLPQMHASYRIDVVADRLDHGIVYLPHQWEVALCPSTPTCAPASRSLA